MADMEMKNTAIPRIASSGAAICADSDSKSSERIGYASLLKEVKEFYPVTQKTLKHNIEQTRLVLANWADAQIQLGNLE